MEFSEPELQNTAADLYENRYEIKEDIPFSDDSCVNFLSSMDGSIPAGVHIRSSGIDHKLGLATLWMAYNLKLIQEADLDASEILFDFDLEALIQKLMRLDCLTSKMQNKLLKMLPSSVKEPVSTKTESEEKKTSEEKEENTFSEEEDNTFSNEDEENEEGATSAEPPKPLNNRPLILFFKTSRDRGTNRVGRKSL